MPPEAHLDPSQLDFGKVVADAQELRRVNPQRFEMEQLDAIVYVDRVRHLLVGYKDVRPDEFWIRGHMPGYPLMPGVLMCEAAAQLASYYVVITGLLKGDFIGFGGLDKVRFRGLVRPGDRLILVGQGIRMNPRQTIFNVQGFVGPTMVRRFRRSAQPRGRRQCPGSLRRGTPRAPLDPPSARLAGTLPPFRPPARFRGRTVHPQLA
jgi:3-hydroxyacyl-[acyl-carrier-protein] dehydratase